ncbi:MAG: YkgJ family cysteine cluster protein [Planctomycetota bacterium]
MSERPSEAQGRPEKLEWFDRPEIDSGEPGLRFSCTMCGNCCSGPEGYVLFTDEEGDAMARSLGLAREVFDQEYTRETPLGTSLAEKPGPDGSNDCVFLDRERVPGRAVCGLYDARPEQCRTWPFWGSTLESPSAWRRAGETCPGLNTGDLIPPEQIRVLRAKVPR